MSNSTLGRLAAGVAGHLVDASVLASFSSIGVRVHRLVEGWSEPPPGVLTGRHVVVSGALSGRGLAAAAAFGRLGADLTLIVGDRDRGLAAATTLRAATGATTIEVAVADLADLDSVGQVAHELLGTARPIDALVHGAHGCRASSADEHGPLAPALSVGLVGPHLLTASLRPALRGRGNGAANVVFLPPAVPGPRPIGPDDLTPKATPSALVAAARVARAQLALAAMWAGELAPDGITVTAVHPGWDEPAGRAIVGALAWRATRPLWRTPGEAADTLIWLVAVGPPAGGPGPLREAARGARSATPAVGMWLDRRWRPLEELVGSALAPGEARRLWDHVCTLAGTPARRGPAIGAG